MAALAARSRAEARLKEIIGQGALDSAAPAVALQQFGMGLAGR